jgi:hypothetical protein
MAAWIRIRIRNADPDPGGNKRKKMKGKTQPKDRELFIKSMKNKIIGTGRYKQGYMWLYFNKI